MQYYFSREMLESCEFDLPMDSASLKHCVSSLSSCLVPHVSQSLSTADGMQFSSAVSIGNAIILAVQKNMRLSMHCIPCSTQRRFFIEVKNNECLFFHMYFHSWCYLASCRTNDAGQIYAAVACESETLVKCLTAEQHDGLCSEIRCHKHLCAELSDHQSGFRYTPWLAWRAHARLSISGHLHLKAVQVALPLGYADSRLLPIGNHTCCQNGLHTPYHAFLTMHARSCVLLEKKIYLLANAKTNACTHKVNRLPPVSTLSMQSLKVSALPDLSAEMPFASWMQLFRAHPYRRVASKLLNVSKSLLDCVVARPVASAVHFAGSLQRLGGQLQARGSLLRRFRSLCVCVLLCMSCRASGTAILRMMTMMLLALCPNIAAYAWLALFSCFFIAKYMKSQFYKRIASFRVCLDSDQNRPVVVLEIGGKCKKNSPDTKQHTRLHTIHHQPALVQQRLIHS